jgi:hypothetical protein
LTDRLVEKIGRVFGSAIRIERPFAPRQRVPPWVAWGAIGSAIEQQYPTLLLLRGVYDHFTVASGLTTNRLVLFDSYGFQWVNRTSCSIGATRPRKRHQIAPASITILHWGDDHARAG